jgi:hypothetical protein
MKLCCSSHVILAVMHLLDREQLFRCEQDILPGTTCGLTLVYYTRTSLFAPVSFWSFVQLLGHESQLVFFHLSNMFTNNDDLVENFIMDCQEFLFIRFSLRLAEVLVMCFPHFPRLSPSWPST